MTAVESAKLKNIVLIILVITNLLLGTLMVVRGVTSRQRQNQLLLDAVALLSDKGIALDPAAVPRDDFPPSMTLERDADWEARMFAGLLGEDLTATQRGLVSYYESGLGRAEVREDGSFAVFFAGGALPLEGQDLSAHGLDTLQRMGFDAAVLSQGEETLEAVQLLNGSPVFSCTAALRYENGALTEISGVRLLGAPAADTSAAAPLSIPTLLLRFRAGIIDSGDACSAILSATQGYVLSSGPAGHTSLTPVLQLETDTSLYLVDALTGAMERE